MSRNERFFRTFWPVVGPVVTAHRAETKREVSSLLRMLRLRSGVEGKPILTVSA